jgi:hypothetical protein
VDGTATYIQRLGDANILSADAVSLIVGYGATIGYIVIAILLLIATRAQLGYRKALKEA